MIETVVKEFPFQVVATTLRKAKTATRNDWGAICYHEGAFFQATEREERGNSGPRRRRRFIRVGIDLWFS